MHEAVKLFREDMLSVSEETLSGVIHVSVTWRDRQVAAIWCNSLIEFTNRQMQSEAEAITARRVRFLQEEYGRADLVAVQSAIGALLQTELTRKMDSITRPEFAFRVVDPAAAPDDRYPVRPHKAVVGLVAGVAGTLIGLAVLVVRRRRAR